MRRSNKMMGSRRRRRHHHLPEEIIEDILVKLPVKSIIRFKSVSKSFFNLIKSTRFIHKHLIENDESFLAIFLVTNQWNDISTCIERVFLSLCSYDDHKETSDTWPVLNFELPAFLGCLRNLNLVGHINGIMCVTNYDIIMLINPSLAELKLLPLPPSGKMCIKLVGFGFDDMTMDFKVVRVTTLFSGGVYRQWGEVYSLSSNSWSKWDEIPFVVYDSTHCSTFFNGVIHWCVETGKIGELFTWRILTFNLATELFQQIEFPQGLCTDLLHTALRLFVLNQESLAFVSYKDSYKDYCSQYVDVWTMNKNGTEETWTKLYSIGPLTNLSKPIAFLKKHKFLYKAYSTGLISYDLLDHRSSVVCDQESQIPLGDPNCYPFCFETGVCSSSLLSLKM